MLGLLTKYSLRHRPIVLAALTVFVLYGVLTYIRLPVEAYPDVTNVQVQVITLYAGHAAEEVEKQITIPMENALNSIPKRVSIRSISMFGLSVVTIVFEDDANRAFVRSQAFELMTGVNLPAGAQASLSPDATPVGEIFRYTVQGPPGMPLTELKSIEDWVVERQFRSVPGVVDVNGFGGPTKQYQVLVDPLKMRSYAISMPQVFNALANGNRNGGGSYIEHGSELYIVRGVGLVQNLDDIRDIAVDTRGGKPIRIKDIGEVVIGNAIRLGRVNKAVPGEPNQPDVIQGIVLMRKGENALDILARVRDKAKDINERFLPPGVRLEVHYDRTALIERTLHTVRKNMAEGIGLVVLVLVLFLGLGNYRSAIIVAMTVPLSLLGAFTLLDLEGIPANLISMGAIDFGIIVDSSVVVVENLLRMLEEQHKHGERHPLHQNIITAVKQMGGNILCSKSILLAAFLPLFTLQRVEGKIFRPMALTLSFALITGTILALTIIPVLASWSTRRIAWKDSWVVRHLVLVYKPLLDSALRMRKAVLAFAFLTLVAAAIALKFLGSEFLPKLDEGSLWVRVRMPESISPTEAMKYAGQITDIVKQFPETRVIVGQTGRPDDGTDVNGFDVTEFYVDLIPREQWTTAHDRDSLCNAMNAKLQAALPGIEFEFSQYIEDNVNEAVSGIKGELGIKIFGEDPFVLNDLAEKITDIIRNVPGAADVGHERLLGQPQVQISVDRRAISRYGLAVNDVQTFVETALGGGAASQVLEGERTFDLVVKLDAASRSNIDAIKNVPLFGASGERITLDMVAPVSRQNGFARIYREENTRRIAVKMSVRGRDLGSLVADAQARVEAKVKLPKGYRMVWTGAFENQQRAVKRLAIVVPISLGIIFFLLFLTFDSGWIATLIILNVPFAAVGGVFAVLISGLTLSVSALVGFLALFGIAVQDGVLLISRIRELAAEGVNMATAVKEGALTRVRPVVMTATMAALGLLPAALSHGVGAETSRPFATVIIGGLVTSTLLTLFILPMIYPSFHKWAVPKPNEDRASDTGTSLAGH